MSLSMLSRDQIIWITGAVAAYIAGERKMYAHKAMHLIPEHKEVLCPFFPASALNSTRVLALAKCRVDNPPFYRELLAMGLSATVVPDFAGMSAITFVNVVVSHEPITSSLLFHELVHVVQYKKLGLTQFAEKYVSGFLIGGSYEAIPLERNAHELEARYEAEPTSPFSVEDEVQSCIDSNRF